MLAPVKELLVKPAKELLERKKYAGRYTGLHADLEAARHIREAAAWLCRAQDAGTDRGIAYGVKFGDDWLASYPETTGYIIPTFLALADYTGDASFRTRAIEAGDWEIAVQMPEGAVMAGRADRPEKHPAMFNTGQVLLGWAALLEATGEDRFRAAGTRACEWMVSLQERDGNWIRGNSPAADPRSTVYNVKAAWGLGLFGKVAGRPEYLAAAVRNAEYAVSQQLSNGWIANCCLTDAANPLLHTLAYANVGILEIGVLAGREDLLRAAQRTADALLQLMDSEGFIPGRINSRFHGSVDWCCLTGTAQTSIVWSRLFTLTADDKYRRGAELANRYLMARHDISSPDPRIRGGLAGSWPVWGEYGKYMILNWATKFFIDALMLRR